MKANKLRGSALRAVLWANQEEQHSIRCAIFGRGLGQFDSDILNTLGAKRMRAQKGETLAAAVLAVVF
jgi:hypothetical protein